MDAWIKILVVMLMFSALSMVMPFFLIDPFGHYSLSKRIQERFGTEYSKHRYSDPVLLDYKHLIYLDLYTFAMI
ncbi:MAG: hypothetical protein ACFFEE_10655 [Candidatus Thorarchaeota archaeon]